MVSFEMFETIEDAYGDLKELVEMVKNDMLVSIVVLGEAGVGKTTQLRKWLSHLHNEGKAVYLGGHLTPYALYRHMHRNRSGRIILLDDTESLLMNKSTMSILKQALDTNPPRRVSWNTSRPPPNLPEDFDFTSRVIFVCNYVPKDVGFKAILSRVDKRTIAFTYQEKLALMALIAKQYRMIKSHKLTPNQRMVVFKFITEHTDESTIDFDFRVQDKIERYFVTYPDRWQNMALTLLGQKDNVVSIMKEVLSHSGNNVEKQVKQFCDRTGLSRRTFFLYKKRYFSSRC